MIDRIVDKLVDALVCPKCQVELHAAWIVGENNLSCLCPKCGGGIEFEVGRSREVMRVDV